MERGLVHGKKDPANVKGILLDVDQTVIDFAKMKNNAVNAARDAAIDAGLDFSPRRIDSEIRAVYDEKGIEYQNVFDDMLMNLLGRIDPKILAAMVVAYRAVKEGYVRPYPDVRSTLRTLTERGYKLGVISDAPEFQLWTRLAGMGLHKDFEEKYVISLQGNELRKPNQLPYKMALGRFGLKPYEMAMVGDDTRRDIAGGNRMGMVTVWAKYGSIFPRDEDDPYQVPDITLHRSIGELKRHFKGPK